MPKKVVITGMGAVTPLANQVRDTWKGLTSGASGVGHITIFDASTFPTNIAGEVKNFDFKKWTSRAKDYSYLGRNSFFALEAADEAMKDAGLSASKMTDTRRFGVYFGAGDGGFDFLNYAPVVAKAIMGEEQTVNSKVYFDESVRQFKPQALLEQEPCQVIYHLSEEFGAKGPVLNCLTACAASSQAIGEASELIRGGKVDIMMAGGTHSMIHPLGVAGFNLLTALSTRNDAPTKASRPFDKTRDGFVLSEGAGVVILEEYEHAKKRGAKIYAELCGYGVSADAFRLTDPHPQGRGAVQAMRTALANAGMKPKDIHTINAHGTSTELNDQIETQAIKLVFGGEANKIPVSSIKSMLGHMIAAAGVVELIASVLTIQNNLIPPTINYENPDEFCDLDYVPNTAREARTDTVLSNSFGFGGQNVALIVKRM